MPANDQTVKSIAVAMVAISKAVSSICPDYRRNLQDALAGAEAAGIDDADLAFLRMIILSAKAAETDHPTQE